MTIKATIGALLLAGTALCAPATWAQEVQRGGTLNFTAPYGSSVGTLDITASAEVQTEIVAHAMHRSLYKWNPETGKPEPDLFTEVTVSDDGMTHTYKLRDDAVFHNDKPFTADDVIYSYNRIATPATASPSANFISRIQGFEEVQGGNATEMSGLKKIDDHTLEITFTASQDPGFDLMQNYVPIYPSNVDGNTQATQPVGLGPFRFVEHVPGSRVSFERFEGFFGEDDQPYLDRLNILIMGEAAARDVAFRNREIDVSVLGSQQYQEYQADADLSKGLLEVAELFTRVVGFDTTKPPFDDKRVRQAVNHGIDKDLIIDRLVKGKAFPAVGFMPTTSPAFDPDAQGYAYDPEKAKALLEEAGHPDGIDLPVIANQNESWGAPIVEAIIPMLAKANIRASVEPVENAVLEDRITGGNFTAFIWSLSSGPDPLNILRCFYSKTAQSACNYTNFSNAEVDRLYEAAQQERDETKRNDLIRQADGIIREEAPYWFFNYNKAVMAYQPWVHGLRGNPQELAIQDYEKIWIDDTAPADRKPQ
ncbi:ABC transporter substrate-binding protein [Paracoccus acridae]|uniref:ABC transporter substrate-binding protein n=1 Tax=Paracoccus acridae TaxID=1795310 RepID=A0ABQ1VMD8_9RHOB|nr:ABC transporter substrate-binding protein [Paracoccus acridae]GGF79872.1 ABC transporter substrate-binding protein [Paracoccus acridae]